MAFEFLDHTADIKIRASGKDLSQAFSEAARAVTEAIAGKSEIEPKVERKVEVVIHKPQILLHDFLTEVIFLFSTEGLLFSEFDVDIRQSMGYKLSATLRGEEYDESRHSLVKEVKAVTYHDMMIDEGGDSAVVEFICDA